MICPEHTASQSVAMETSVTMVSRFPVQALGGLERGHSLRGHPELTAAQNPSPTPQGY